jgi:hypothetical protein
MANWKKVIVSGSNAELTSITSSVLTNDNLLVAGPGGAIENSGLTYNGTTLTLGSSSITSTGTGTVLTGSFAGSFSGSVIIDLEDLTNGTGITAFTYDGNAPATVAISGASTLNTNRVTKWTGNAFADSNITDNGTTVSISTPLNVTGNITSTATVSGSALAIVNNGTIGGTLTTTGRLTANGDITTTNITSSGNISSSAGLIGATLTTSGNATVGGTLTVAGNTNLNGDTVIGDATSDTITTTARFISDLIPSTDNTRNLGTSTLRWANIYATSITASSVTGSFVGDGSGLTGITASQTANSLTNTANGGISTFTFNGSSAVNISVSGSRTAGRVPVWSGNAFNDSTITDNGTTATFTENAVFNKDITVLGTASFQNTTNLEVADRFVLFASGSNTAGDGGIVIQQATQDVGEVFGYDSGTTRWGLTGSFTANQSSFTPDAFMAAVTSLSSTNPNTSGPAARYNAVGNIYVSSNDESIWIYS